MGKRRATTPAARLIEIKPNARVVSLIKVAMCCFLHDPESNSGAGIR
jgi:hypothetical protein